MSVITRCTRDAMPGFIMLLLITCLLTPLTETEASVPAPKVTGSIIVVNDGPGNQTDPHVDGNIVAYTSSANGTTQIRYFNFATKTDLGIPTTGSSLDFLSDVSGSMVVFSRVDLGVQSIWTFETMTGGPAVMLAPAAVINRRGGVIGGPTVAWQDLVFTINGITVSEIMAYDLPTGMTTRLTTDAALDRSPAVSPDGRVIVWEKCATSIAPCNIWQAVKEGNGWIVSQVTDTPDDERFADTNGTLVVYGGSRANSATGADIYWKPVEGGKEEQLALPAEQRNPNISGSMIAFESRDLSDPTPNWDIYLYDTGTTVLYSITNTPGTDEVLNDISVNQGLIRIVWSVLETDHNVYAMSMGAPVANAGPDQTVHIGTVATLDGSASADPDQRYPLTYAWTMTKSPGGSQAVLSGAATVNPSFKPDLPGEYIMRLVVQDASGLYSMPDDVIVNTSNSAPVADAGPDQAVTVIGSTVSMDGSGSYDLEGDPFSYQWTMLQRPAGSMALLSHTTVSSPTFIADVHGDYVLALVVSDAWSSGAADTVTVSFSNSKPVADAGGNQAVMAGSQVTVDGGGSSDVNGDPLSYSWSFVSIPAGSAAVLAPVTAGADFLADQPGTYVVSLVVNDGLVDSDPASITIVATSGAQDALSALRQAIDKVNHMTPGSFKNGGLGKTLTNKINAAILMIDQGAYKDALDKLQDDILTKTDGCASAGTPDKNDWVLICTEQKELYAFILEATALLRLL